MNAVRQLQVGLRRLSPKGPVAGLSIESTLRWLVTLCTLPAATLPVMLLCTDPRVANLLGMPALGATTRSLGWWMGIVAVVSIVVGLALAQVLARQIAGSLQGLAEAAERLADGQPMAMPPMHIAQAAKTAAAFTRIAALLQERTGQRDRAAEAATHLRDVGRKLQHQASHDALTGLVNRARFDTVIGQCVAACDRSGQTLTLLYIDVDGFKRINDRHGHAVGDELLRLFAARIECGVRESEVVARLGGDEFAVILSHALPSQSLDTADRLIDQLSRPYRVGELTVEVSASIGLAAYPESARCAHTLLQAADAAMYLAKNAGKCRYATSGFGGL